ncbi:MFS general substrate transporter [Thozetella sp. PMI_491]|nr:MFS general substrate transporter [Thozetella sp. PMI_491]
MAQALVPARIIGNTFPDTNPGKLAWYSAAYGLTAGTFVLPAGRLGDVFGHKAVVVVGFLWLAAWSFAAGFAPSVGNAGGLGTIFFCFSRAMQGIGSALVVPNGQGILGRAYPPGPRKNIVMSMFGAAAPLGFVVGAAMSSLFAEQAQWPWAFWTLAALCVALAALSILALPSSLCHGSQVAKQIEEGLWVRLDVPGIMLGISGLVLFNFAFNQAPIVSWRTPYTYFILIIGALLLAGFTYTQQHARHPLVPVSAMHTGTNFVLGCTAAGWGCFGVWVYYAFTFLENFRGWSPLTASAALAPAPIAGLIASLLTGFLMSRGVRPHWIMLASMFSFLVGSLLFATAPVAQSYWFNTFFGIVIMPFGMDMSNPAATMYVADDAFNLDSSKREGEADPN